MKIKKIVIFAVLITSVYTQSYVDIVTLKNGDIIKGKIIENVINDHIRIELQGGSILTYQYVQIESLEVEKQSTQTLGSGIQPVNPIVNTTPSLFFEPEIGLYKPSDSDFEGDNSPRFGGNIGMNMQNDLQIYGGIKVWINEYDDVDSFDDPITIGTNANWIILGGRKVVKLQDNPVNLRFGGEFLIANFRLEYDDQNYDSYDYTATGSGNGFAIEGGALFNVGGLQLFAGVNYLILEVEYEEFEIGGDTYSANELGIGKEESTNEGNGPNFKVSVMFSL
jgi:hypothetical protein